MHRQRPPSSRKLPHLLTRLMSGLMLLTAPLGCGTEAQVPAEGMKGFQPTGAPAAVTSQPQALAEDAVMSSEPTWTLAANMASGRMLHTSVLLPDGRVLTLGGARRSVELYDPETNTWSRASDALNTHRAATATVLRDGVVLVAGRGGVEWDSRISAELYDFKTGAWKATGNMTTPRMFHTATLLPGGQVLVTGGVDAESGGRVLNAAEVYDPATRMWTQHSPMSTARRNHTAVLLRDGRVLVAGGTDADGMPSRSAEVFNPVQDTWSPVGDMMLARVFHSATELQDGRVLAVGGGGSTWEGGVSAEVFDPTYNEWKAVTSLGKARREHSATLLPNGMVVVAGGFHEDVGSHTSAEAYDPATDTWLSAGTLAVDRYQHTATLLANGKLLVAGGNSKTDQTSAELLLPHFQRELEVGTGWKRVSVSGVMEETGQPYSATLYTLQDPDGISQAPLPPSVREDLAASVEPSDLVYMLDQAVLDEIRISEAQGRLTPALEAIAEPLGSESSGAGMGLLGGRCPDEQQGFGRSFQARSYFSRSGELVSGLNGSLTFKAESQANAWGELVFNKLRTRVLWWCVPYGATFKHARAHGEMTINSSSEIQGTLSYANPRPWEREVGKPHLFSSTFFVGPVPVHVGFNMPITVGLELQADVTGNISFRGSQLARGSFNYTCTSAGCWGNSHFDLSMPTSPGSLTGGVSGRIQPSMYAQVALRGYAYHEGFAYAQLGVRPYLRGDLWGYAGNNCGDANGDGNAEFVRALTLDLDLQVHLTGQASVFSREPWRWNDIWHTPRYHLGFWDLVGSSAMEPMLNGPARVGINSNYPSGAKMRPCWPYQDNVDYSLSWGDGARSILGGDPRAWLTANHSWPQQGQRTLALTVQRDNHGRQLNKTTSRAINVENITTLYFDYTAADTNNATRNTTDRQVALQAGQTITVATCDLEGTSTTGDTYLRLNGPTGQQVAENDNTAGCNFGAKIVYTVPAGGDGTYTIKAGCYSAHSCGGRVGYRF